MDDTFTLYDLKVEVVATDRPMVFHVFLKCPSSGASGKAAATGSQ